MIEALIQFIATHIVPLGTFGIILAGFIDEAFPLIPASIVLLSLGFFFVHGTWGIPLIKSVIFGMALPAAFGLTLGSLLIYTIFYFGGKPVLDRYGHFIGVSWKDILWLREKLSKTRLDEWLIVLLWTLPIIPSGLFGVFGGTIRVPLKKYIAITFIGTFLKAATMGLVGWWVGHLYIQYAIFIHDSEEIIFLIAVIAVLSFIWYRKNKRKVLG